MTMGRKAAGREENRIESRVCAAAGLLSRAEEKGIKGGKEQFPKSRTAERI